MLPLRDTLNVINRGRAEEGAFLSNDSKCGGAAHCLLVRSLP